MKNKFFLRRENRQSERTHTWQVIFSFLLVLAMSIGQMWGAINNTTVTKVGGSQKYIDVTTTSASNGDEVTVSKQYIAYTISELVSNAIKDVWYTQSSSGSGSSATDAVSITGYRSACSKYIPISSSKKYTHYVTNCVSFSALYDPRAGSRYCTITATNVDDAEDIVTVTNSGTVSSGTKYNVELTGLSASKYYSVVVETNNSSESRLYQIRLGAYVNTTGPFAITYDKNDEGASGTMTDGSSPYAKNSTVTVLANSFTAPTGKVFVEWNTKADGSGDSYDAGDTFSATEDVTLYAQWAYPATGTGTITYSLTSNANAVSAAVSGVSTLSSSSTAFTLSTLTCGSGNSKAGYSGQIQGHAADYSASQYVALQFTVADGYTFTPSSVAMTVFANGTSNMKMKVKLTDGTTSVESNELACSNSADSDISFASGAFTNKKFAGNVDVIVYQWGVTSKRAYIKSPVTITGTVAPACQNVSAPTSLAENTEERTVNSLTYTWTKADHASGYTATLYSNSGCTSEVESKELGDVATVTFNTGLSASTNYWCKVQSKGDGSTYCAEGGVTSAAQGTTATPSCGVVTAPMLLQAGSITAEGATLLVTDPADAMNYEFYFSEESTEPETSATATHTSTTKEKAITGLTSGTTYYVWVRSVCDADHKSIWVALDGDKFKVKAEPTTTFANGTYIIGSSALDLSTLIANNNSAGAITYEITDAGTTSASLSTAAFSATAMGTATVKATQAAYGDFTEKVMSATITVLDDELTDIYVWKKGSGYGGDGKCVSGSEANVDANANVAYKELNYSSQTMTGMSAMGRPASAGDVTITLAVKDGYTSLFGIKSVCAYGKIEEAGGIEYSWDNTNWTAVTGGEGSDSKHTFTAPAATYPTALYIRFTNAVTGSGGLWFRNALVTLEAIKTVSSTTEDLQNVKINDVAISSSDLATLKSAKTLDIATTYAVAPTVTFVKRTTVNYEGGWPADVTDENIDVTASDETTHWEASQTISEQAYTVTLAKPAGPSLETATTSLTVASEKIKTDSKSFTFSGANLEGNVSIALESAVAGMSVSPASVTPTAGAITDAEVTVSYKSLEAVASTSVNLIVRYDDDVKLTIPVTYSSTVGYEDLTSISAATTWNWNGAADAAIGTVIDKSQMIILANADATWDENFNARAIAGKLEYMYRDSKYAQGEELKFNTTVPGKVFVTYSNTGGNAARTVNVNGVKGSLSSSNNKDADKCTESFLVSAGDVLIKGVQVSDNAAKYLRFYQVRFAPVYSVTYNAGDGSVKEGETIPTHADEAAGEKIYIAAADVLEKDGYDFAGWLCDIDDDIYGAGAEYTMTAAATTFTAQWIEHVEPVDPTLTYDNGAYTIGLAALDLSTLITAKTSTGAITYSVKEAGTTGAAIDGNNFTATAAGTATITASQAAVLGYNAKTVDFDVVVTEAVEIDGIKMVEAGALTGNFVSARTLSNGDNTIEGIAYTKYLTMSSTMTSFGNEVAPSATKGIYYYPSHKNIRFYFYVNNNQSSAKKIYIYTVDEDAESTSDATSANVSVDPGRHLVYADVELTKHAAVVFGVENTGTQICQIVAVESGDELLQGGEAGYSIDYNKCYISPKAGTVAVYDGIEYKLYADAKLVSATNVQLQTLGTHYIKFHLDAPMTINVYADNKKYYIGSECSTDAAAMTYEATGDGEFSLAAGDWYINGSGVQVKINKLSFSAPKCAEPAFNALANSDICEGASYEALDGTATVADAGVPTYQWYNADGDEAIDGATNATYTPTADGNYYVIATNHLADHSDNAKQSATVTVTTYASAQITTAPVDVRQKVGEDATLTVVASGKAPLSYQWYTCDENGDNTAIIAGAENASYTVNVTANLDQYYKVVVSSGCGEASAVARIVEWVALPQLSVSTTTTWDWTYISDQNITLTDQTVPAKNEECVLANVKVGDKMPTNDETFNSQALLFYGEHVRNVESGRKYASIGHIKFTTTVSGKVTVEFSDNGNNNRKVKINDAVSESSASKTDVKTFSAVVPAGEVNIEGVKSDGTGSNQYIRISKIIFSTTDVEGADYTRDVRQGYYGTICLPNGGVMVGAQLFEVAYYGASSEKIFFDEIINGVMEAGVPYIFLPREGATQLGVYYTDAADASAGSHNGLIGSYTHELVTPNDDNYILLNNQYCYVNSEAYVGANRAYIKLSDITPSAPALAPGRMRMSMGVVGAPKTPTGMENVGASNKPVKVMIDGQLFILRGEKMYDATGRLVK